ncbi:MAG: DUF1801 domain-containing protein [Tannerellaceae bacterium]|jgi:uncharacterized protein YdhG (YjbR/CyaY superfamily)|nr:DUF1801 domain-containing protein [Tannerellaceae bacterium]
MPINNYIASQPPEVQPILRQLYKLVKDVVPQAEERISYNMPAFYINKRPLVYFSAFSKHIGFYPIPSGMEAFKDELAGYKQGKGSVQFPLNKPMPIDLIRRIIEFRAKENGQ